jgi:hypothetical protein
MATSRQVGFRQGHVAFHVNDENKNSGKQKIAGDSGKTPINSTKRRAFGDISNRKSDRNQISVGSAALKVNNNISTVKSVASVSEKGATHAKPEKGSNFLPKARKVNFILPSEQSRTNNVQNYPKQESTVTHKELFESNLEDSFEIEQPAGRTWAQQHANGDHDESISDCSLEGVETLLDDHIRLAEIFIKQHKQRIRDEEEAERKEYEGLILKWKKYGFGDCK